MYRNFGSHDLFSELNRLQRIAARVFDASPNIRGLNIRGLANYQFPAINVSTSPQSVEIDCYAPGVDPKKIEVKIEQNVLSVSGDRPVDATASKPQQTSYHIGERFNGRFHRVIALPDDVDGNAVSASYTDGVLKIKAPRVEAAQPRRIVIQ